MVKHNNVIPNVHCKKKWLASSRGPLKVKLSLDQATKKKARRLRRAAKAAKIAPRPLQLLRPAVRCQTQRYSSKVRTGRGFTLQEIRAAELTPAYARTVGIAVDHRRTNKSEESLDANVARLKEYTSKLIVFPKRRGGSKVDTSKFVKTQTGVIMPIVKSADEIVMAEVTKAMKDSCAYTQMRVARNETKVRGFRAAVVNRKKSEKK